MSDDPNAYLRNWKLETLEGVREVEVNRQRQAQRTIDETMGMLAAIDAELARRKAGAE